jgi:signal peptidase I
VNTEQLSQHPAEEPENTEEEKYTLKEFGGDAMDILECVAAAVFVVILCFTFVICIARVDGTSMVPTLQDGQTVLFNKTHDVHVGDIVVAESDEYGGIIKRVDEIDGNRVHLISDNKEVTYEYIDGYLYETKGITTWVDISDINGVVIDY